MPEPSKGRGGVEAIQAAINAVRDGVILFVLLLLLIWPGTVNRILSHAGFTKISIAGFEWEKKIEEALAQTEAAQREVDRLSLELGRYANRFDEVGREITAPAARAQVQDLAASVRTSQTAALNLSRNLKRTALDQRDLRDGLKARLQDQHP